MRPIATGLGIAAALSVAVSLGAQTTSTTTTTTTDRQTATESRSDKGREVTVTGCLAREGDGVFVLNHARMGDASSTDTTTTTGTTGTTGSSTVGATAAEPDSPVGTISWKLEGGKDLERHIGHTIQVTGRTEWSENKATASATSTTTMKTEGAHLDVSSIKMVSSSCQ
jgi:hypothetical protein